MSKWLAHGQDDAIDPTGHGSTNIPATTLAFNMVASIRGTVAIERHDRPSRTYAGKAWPNELPA